MKNKKLEEGRSPSISDLNIQPNDENNNNK